jgi:hypothetical protein
MLLLEPPTPRKHASIGFGLRRQTKLLEDKLESCGLVWAQPKFDESEPGGQETGRLLENLVGI